MRQSVGFWIPFWILKFLNKLFQKKFVFLDEKRQNNIYGNNNYGSQDINSYGKRGEYLNLLTKEFSYE